MNDELTWIHRSTQEWNQSSWTGTLRKGEGNHGNGRR